MSEFLEKRNQVKNNFRVSYIRCSCDGEILVTRYDGELDTLDLCLFQNQRSFNHTLSFWQKLRYIYNLFKTGQPFTDQILLQREQIDELKGFLNSISV